jgi:hypothetical protein
MILALILIIAIGQAIPVPNPVPLPVPHPCTYKDKHGNDVYCSLKNVCPPGTHPHPANLHYERVIGTTPRKVGLAPGDGKCHDDSDEEKVSSPLKPQVKK